jgi:predicted component of type VI protein secretion system
MPYGNGRQNRSLENARDKNLNPSNTVRVSDELYSASIAPMNHNPEKYSLSYKTAMIHLIDSVSRGYTTPAEAWDAIALGYVPEHLTVRKSAYQHLV